VDQPAATFGPETIRAVFRNRPDPYAGMDVEEGRRIGGLLCLVVAALIPVLSWASSPDERIGDEGWLIAAGIAAAYLAFAYVMLRPGARIGYDGMLFLNYVGIAQVAALVWLAGGAGTPYPLLFLAPGVLPPSVHPPRRALPLLGALTVAIFLPLTYDGWNGGQAAEMGLLALFIWMFALMLMALTNAVRDQRLVLLSEGQAANRLARRDELTGLGNRRAFDEMLERELARSRRSGAPISVALLDLDRFKSINDRFGHTSGDRALQAVAEALRSSVRLPDSAFRWGGDEFALILPDSDAEGAREVGERIRANLASDSPLPDAERLGFSIGVAELGEDQSADSLLAEADTALYQQKHEHGAARVTGPKT
jgi:diguanylate cyclase (GGDEF)-like protein